MEMTIVDADDNDVDEDDAVVDAIGDESSQWTMSCRSSSYPARLQIL